MSKRNYLDLLDDILESINRIQTYSKDLTYYDFCSNLLVQDAIVRNIEIIGETTKKLSIEIKKKYPKINWKEIAGIRNKLIHDYSSVNYDIVWDILGIDIPILKEQIEEILKIESHQ
jgi:uncharacterized protein with HEPN domain